jgi:hypothetical protein
MLIWRKQVLLLPWQLLRIRARYVPLPITIVYADDADLPVRIEDICAINDL